MSLLPNECNICGQRYCEHQKIPKMGSNLNLELIEKVKSGKFAIYYNLDNVELLQCVLNSAFPLDNCQTDGANIYYYAHPIKGSQWFMGKMLPKDKEAIPLSAFFTNELPKEDKQLISKIDELLGQLKTISQSVFELREHASLVLPDVAPIEQVEQPKWKEGELVKDNCGNLAVIVEIAKDGTLIADNYSPFGGLIYINKEFVFKPTPKEIEQHLTNIARKKYPVGTKVKTITGTFVISSHEFRYNHDNNSLLSLIRYGGKDYYKTVWNVEDSWATIVKEEVKERFSVEVYQPTLTGDEGFKIHISPTFKMRKPMADEIATKIKALLATI